MTRRHTAFTLVELLVVIGIVAILVAFLMPALTKAREQAIRVQCLSNLHQIAIGVIGYAVENRGYVPGPHAHSRPNCLNDPFSGQVGMPLNDLRVQFQNYVRDPHVFYCPANLELFYKERPIDPVWSWGWFEGWDAASPENFCGYAYWPQFIYDGTIGIQTIWTYPEERPDAKLDAHRKILWTDLSQDAPDPSLRPIGLELGYIWFNHGRGGGSEPDGNAKDPTWAARAYTDGSAIGSQKPEWQVHVQLSGGTVFKW
jgi:prepilin-type N-terminal cleavage/methylation domain-containing protein